MAAGLSVKYEVKTAVTDAADCVAGMAKEASLIAIGRRADTTNALSISINLRSQVGEIKGVREKSKGSGLFDSCMPSR
jgi:hypothetical protein